MKRTSPTRKRSCAKPRGRLRDRKAGIFEPEDLFITIKVVSLVADGIPLETKVLSLDAKALCIDDEVVS